MMGTGLITMSLKEMGRLEVVQKVISKRLTQVRAAAELKVTARQMRRIIKKYRAEGAQSLLAKRRGRISNNRLSDEVRQKAVSLIQAHYFDFGPTLAHEKLTEKHSLKISDESVRQLMIKAGLWKGKRQKSVLVHHMRERRPCLGELVQIDGSPHDWFEGRAEKCCLLVAIDDATGKLMALHFLPTETTQGYFQLLKAHLKRHGRPLACYHDKHGIFQVNAKEVISSDGITQFRRAMSELGMESISANTPQAKGRVERANKTLQDRLIKEMRLEGINDIDSANLFLPQFIEDFNRRFAVQAKSSVDAHRKTMPEDVTLDLILSEQYTRKKSFPIDK